MSEAVRQDGNVTGEAASLSQAEGSTSGPAPVESAQEESQAGEQRERFIPRARFDQVNTQRQQAEYERDRLRQQNQAWTAWYAGHQTANNQAQPTNGQPRKESPEETIIRDALGRDEAGEKAFQLMERHFKHKSNTDGLVTRAEMQQQLGNVAQGILGKWSTTVQTANRFQDWINKGLVTSEQGAAMNRTLAGWMAQRPEAASSPEVIDMWASHILAKEYEAGNVRPVAKPIRYQPMSPVSGGMPPEQPPVDLSQVASRFSRLKGLNAEQLKKLEQTSIQRHAGAMQ